jgi:hypothetical protein
MLEAFNRAKKQCANGTRWLLEQGSFAGKVGVNLNIIGNMSSDEMNDEIGCLNIRWPTSNPNTQMNIKSLMIKSKLQIYDIN